MDGLFVEAFGVEFLAFDACYLGAYKRLARLSKFSGQFSAHSASCVR